MFDSVLFRVPGVISPGDEDTFIFSLVTNGTHRIWIKMSTKQKETSTLGNGTAGFCSDMRSPGELHLDPSVFTATCVRRDTTREDTFSEHEAR